jgi:SpoIID/LytB domain protein
VRVAPVVALALVAASALLAQAPEPDASRTAWEQIDLATLATIDSSQPARLKTPVQPGSFMKLPTLIAALKAGVISPDTRVACPGEAIVGGVPIRCSHPKLRHALKPSEALAVSCNVYFATIAQHLPRAKLDGVLTALGLPPTPRAVAMPLVATGLTGTPTTPGSLLRALARFVTDPSVVPLDSASRQAVLDGLRGSAVYGTSAAFAAHGVEALAKTGTADAPGGGIEGLVVAVWPAASPTRGIVLLASGAAGTNAADLAAGLAARTGPRVRGPSAGAAATVPAVSPPALAVAARPGGMTLRVGVARAGGGYDVRMMALEDYVAGVLAGEAAAHSPPAALEALAITVRTFAVVNRGRHAREGFDLCTLTHCQVLREPSQATRAATARTAGQILVWHDAPAQVFYTASCGGMTERAADVWPGATDLPYLRPHRDRACNGQPKWASEIPAGDLDRVLHAAGYKGGPLRDVKREGRTASGRVYSLRIAGLVPEQITAQDFRSIVGRSLGWNLIKSTAFTVTRTGSGFRFDGQGFGHGVGLCVLGSVGRAEHGDSPKAILAEYFPGLKIRPMTSVTLPPVTAPTTPAPSMANGEATDVLAGPTFAAGAATTSATTAATVGKPAPTARPEGPVGPAGTLGLVGPAGPGFTLVLPSDAESQRSAITALITRALSDVSKASGRNAPADLRVVFHPTTQSFIRETGESWWSAGRTAGGRIDFQPLSVLADRGTLDTTVRHEIAHVLTAATLEGRPVWVKEGAAMHFAGETPPAALVNEDGTIKVVTCPSDLDLQRPKSAALARQSYELAAACFERALAEKGDWTKVR